MSMGQLVDLVTGQIFPLGSEPVTIGRHEDNTIVLPDPLVSRHHAEITRQGGKWILRDLGSANGTHVNGQRLVAPQVLNHADAIQIGRTRFGVQMLAAMAKQDTLVERLRPEDVLAAQPRRTWLPLALGLGAAVVVVTLLVGLLIALSGTRPDEEEATTQASLLTANAISTLTVSAGFARPTETLPPTIPPPSLQPTPIQPTHTPPPPTDTPLPPPVIGSFYADPETIETGRCSRLVWGQVENADSITLSGVGPVNVWGKLDVCLDASKSYTLQATGPGGTVEQSVQITVQPPSGSIIEYFRVVPSIIAPGDCALLEWGKVDNATSAVIEPDIGGVGTPGSLSVCPSSTTTYVLTARNPEGSSTAWITLLVTTEQVQTPVIAFFTVNPSRIVAGQCATLSWGKVDYATEVLIDQEIGGVGTPGSIEVCPGETTTYLMTAVGPGGTAESSVTVTVSSAQLADLPDLVIESILFVPNPCYRGQKCKVEIKVRNDGPVGAGHFIVRWTPASPVPVPVEWDVDLLGAGQEKELKYTWMPNRADDEWQTSAMADAYGEVAEIDKENNKLDQVVAVLEP